MVDFWSIADNLDQCQPTTSASFALINDDDNDDKDADIHIILSINNADVDFEDIAIVLTPLRHFPIRV